PVKRRVCTIWILKQGLGREFGCGSVECVEVSHVPYSGRVSGAGPARDQRGCQDEGVDRPVQEPEPLLAGQQPGGPRPRLPLQSSLGHSPYATEQKASKEERQGVRLKRRPLREAPHLF